MTEEKDWKEQSKTTGEIIKFAIQIGVLAGNFQGHTIISKSDRDKDKWIPLGVAQKEIDKWKKDCKMLGDITKSQFKQIQEDDKELNKEVGVIEKLEKEVEQQKSKISELELLLKRLKKENESLNEDKRILMNMNVRKALKIDGLLAEKNRILEHKDFKGQLKEYEKIIAERIFKEMDTIHDWTDLPEDEIDCVCSKKEYEKIRARHE